jgi:hypothetical protein
MTPFVKLFFKKFAFSDCFEKSSSSKNEATQGAGTAPSLAVVLLLLKEELLLAAVGRW